MKFLIAIVHVPSWMSNELLLCLLASVQTVIACLPGGLFSAVFFAFLLVILLLKRPSSTVLKC